ncbi:hypothetical protein HMI54_009849 [Coelomomyces lativittatus]|nr:hypothetical protein HMI56_006230 [Coelomomyces lativittatus]KAJ1512331.1 hypothetical protein HMI55_006275 [Coelomomyces lativittatus]KAJ1516334.1 hypothetical protein HMI54_009849 [Coelomomyces lativittatus]
MQEIEVPPRDSFKYYVKINEAPKTVMWNFSTRKNNINFGLFFQKSEDLPNEPNDLREIRSTSSISKNPSSQVETSPSTKRKTLLSFSSSKLSSQDNLETPLSEISSPNSTRRRTKIQTTSVPESNLEEILPIQRYESSKAAVKGQYTITKNGVYVLYFDNTFSINTSKKLIFFVAMHSGEAPISSTKPDLEGWLFKRKRKKLQGWAKRYFICDKGQLAYFKFPGGFCRGSIPITYSTLSVDPEHLYINIDSGTTIWHLCALNREDYNLWLNSIKQFKAESAEAIKLKTKNEKSVIPITSNAPLDKAVGNCLERIETEVKELASFVAKDKSSKHRGSFDETGLLNQVEKLTELVLKEKGDILDQLECEVKKSETLKAAYHEILRENNELKLRFGIDLKRFSLAQTQALNNSSMESPILSVDSEKFFDAEEIVLSCGESSDSDNLTEENKEMVIFENSDDGDYDDDIDDDDSDYSECSKPLELKNALAVPTSTIPKTVNKENTEKMKVDYPVRRKVLPSKMVGYDVSLISILRKNVGKDLSTVAMPISLNEPLNLLQKMAEDLEYSDLLDKAAENFDPLERLKYVATFAVSGYASSVTRCTRKPFNPLQNETYECVRVDRNFKYISEKVSHNPPIMACHAISPNWIFFQDSRVKTKFWGKSMELIPSGKVNVVFPNENEHFSWTKVTTCMRNIIGGTRSLDHYGKMIITNTNNNYRAEIVFKENSGGWLGGEPTVNQISGAFFDNDKNKIGFLQGKWSEALYFISSDKPDVPEELWQATPPLENQEEMYGFTQFAIELNEITEDIRPYLPPTDSRWRPDQRLLEVGDLEEAEKIKTRLEEKQRANRKKLEAEGNKMMPKWFKINSNTASDDEQWIYKGGYWESREAKDWRDLPDLW